MVASVCATLVEAVSSLRAAGVSFVLVHESALMGWGIDTNAFLEHVDILPLGAEDFQMLDARVPSEAGSHVETELGGIPARLWSRASLGLAGRLEVTSCPRYGCEALAPETVLRKLPFSPDFRMLVEQRARLAAILCADALTDEELELVARYVRGA